LRRLYKHTWFILFLTTLFLKAQELPPIEVFTPQTYGGENQNWAISQSKEKYIYVANTKGLLEFNGAKWQLYPSPNETIVRSVKVVNDKIYTGSFMEFGYWERDNLGILNYTSLSFRIKDQIFEDEQIWNIMDFEKFILFQSLNNIYIYDTVSENFETINSKTTLPKIYKVDESIYFQKLEDGIYKIENGEPILITKDPIIKDNIVVNIFDHQKQLLIQTQNQGFYLLKDGVLKKWDIKANNILDKTSVYSSIKLHDNSFALGTISKGLIHLTEDGIINYEINQPKGLSNNTVLSLFEDQEQNIWLGLDNGINCLNMTSPFKVYNDEDGHLGTIYASAIFKGFLYIGTNQGLFYKAYNKLEEFKFIEGTKGQVWCLQEYDDTLFCGHNDGTFIVEGGKANLICDIDGTWNIKPIPNNEKNLLVQGNYNGLYVLEKIGNKWTFRNKIQGFENSSKHFEFLDYHVVFVSHEYKGIFKITLNDSYIKANRVEKETTVDKGLNASISKYNNDIIYAYKEGVFKYNKISDKFEKDTILSRIFNLDNYTSGKLIVDNNTNTLWGFSKTDLSFISPGKLTSTPKVNKVSFPYSLRKSITGYESISNLEDNRFLLGSSSGYIIIDLDKITNKSYQIHINSITNHALNSKTNFIDKNIIGEFKNNQNNIQFNYSIAEFDKYLESEYQFQLEGFYDEWSEWSTTPEVLFENLPYGNYVFNVRGRVGNNITTNTATFNFTINKPWFLSNTAVFFYILGLLLLSIVIHNVYKHYYKRQRINLLKEKERELELKALEYKEQQMRHENEKLQQDIENKNRELAISTMSLIKKNEFLNSIKSELKETNGSKSLKPVIKIIDKNLNNTDDWKFFQEAFNNADKDFLKKIRSLHPELTPNDLRLCAYLRLNLSSKEIAPLLNISPRSVEVKRYRLRKKMDLDHDSSLTNYILEI
jgi:DNA-binding CsgD family transcriptional regulator